MITSAWIYSLDNGEILRMVTGDDQTISLNTHGGESAVAVGDGEDQGTHYINDGKAVEKTALSPSVEVDGFTAMVSGLPAELEVEFDGFTATTDDDPLEIEADEPGTYKLRINGGAPYISAEVEITFG